jgi:hypothetical protein
MRESTKQKLTERTPPKQVSTLSAGSLSSFYTALEACEGLPGTFCTRSRGWIGNLQVVRQPPLASKKRQQPVRLLAERDRHIQLRGAWHTKRASSTVEHCPGDCAINLLRGCRWDDHNSRTSVKKLYRDINNARVITSSSARTAWRAGVAAPEPAGLADTGAGLPRSTSAPLTMSADSSTATVHCVT